MYAQLAARLLSSRLIRDTSPSVDDDAARRTAILAIQAAIRRRNRWRRARAWLAATVAVAGAATELAFSGAQHDSRRNIQPSGSTILEAFAPAAQGDNRTRDRASVPPRPATRSEIREPLRASRSRKPSALRESGSAASAERAVDSPASNAVGSTLAEQNELFAAALRARRRGDLAEARSRLDELLARFPFGPLTESARAEHRKLAQ